MPNLVNIKSDEITAKYNFVVNKPIDLASAQDPTIFDISGYPHYEDVISNWYAFFFNPKGEHLLGNLFLKSLVKIIKDEYRSDFSMEDCKVKREFPTDHGGFIDLLLYRQSEEGGIIEAAIIIENKIYAGLYNNLDDYYESLKVTDPEQKVGIVLSLHKFKQLPKEFISITHGKLLSVIQYNLGEYIIPAKTKYLSYLQDFIYNLEQMRKMQDSIKFYIEYAEKIDVLLELKKQAVKFISDELKRAVWDKGWTWKRGDSTSFSFQDSNSGVRFYLIHLDIFTKKKFTLQAWLEGEPTVIYRNDEDGQSKIKDKFKDKLIFSYNKEYDKERWVYLAQKEHEISNIENFGKEVFENLDKDWSEFAKDVTILLNTE